MRRTVVFALVALVGMLVVPSVSPANAVVSGENGRIVFNRWDCLPTPSGEVPGRGLGCNTAKVVVANPDGSDELVLARFPFGTTSAGREVNWSPDGTKVIFSTDTCANNDGAGPSGVWTINADGTGLQELRQADEGTCFGEGPVFTPDGTQIIVPVGGVEGYGRSLWVMNSQGTGLTPLMSEPEGFEAYNPEVSPDGSLIAFTQCSESGCNIATVGSDGTNLNLLPYPISGLGTPNWSPDSSTIVFNLNANGCTSDLATVDRDGQNFTQLTFNEPCRVGSFLASYSPDGTKIIFIQWQGTRLVGRADLFTMSPDGTGLRCVKRTAAPENGPQWAVATT